MTNALKIIPLSGLGEIGKNMTVLEYGRDMLIVDCGVKFPDDDMYGIDLVLPQFDYVVQNRAHLRGIVLTHGHLDHIGGLSYLLRQVSTTVYGTALTIGMVKRQLQEANALGSSRLQILQDNERFTLGAFKINPFPVAHSIPGSVGLVIDTPVGSVVHTGDYKLDETPTGGRTTDLKRLRALTPKGVLALLGDSTNADKPGTTPTEQLVAHELDRLFAEARHGRIIIATFGSLLARLREVMALALKHGRKVALTGRSLEQNVDLARELGYIKVPDDLIVPADANVPDDRILILSTGSQGEPRSALNRMATGQHRQVQVKHGDTIIVSGGTIPGNEGDVSRMLDRLFERGANVIYGRLANVHVSGHGSRDEMLAMLKATRPKFLIPVHGEVRHLHLHARLAEAHGMRSDHVFILENGAVLATDGKRAWREQPVPANDVLVDGRLIGEIGEPEMRDRQRLSEDGFIVAMIPVDAQDRLNGEPELISRGFLPAGRAADLIAAARREIRRQHSQGPVRQEAVQTTLQGFFFREMQSRPVVLTSLTRFGGVAAQPGHAVVAQTGRGGQRQPQDGQTHQRRGQEAHGQTGHASTGRGNDGRRPERAGGVAKTGAGGIGAHKGRPQGERPSGHASGGRPGAGGPNTGRANANPPGGGRPKHERPQERAQNEQANRNRANVKGNAQKPNKPARKNQDQPKAEPGRQPSGGQPQTPGRGRGNRRPSGR